MSEGLAQIERPYLLVCPIPHYRHPDGSVWLDRLWHHDLIEHLHYLRHFVLLSPARPWTADADLLRVDPPPGVRFEVVEIPGLDSFKAALLRLPKLAAILWRAIGRVDVVHSGVAGWPIAIGWIANPIALLRGKKLMLVVESAFWRIPEGQPAGAKDRIRSAVTERLGRFFVNRAHLILFTQPSYRESLLTSGKGQAHVTPATWISEADILSEAEATQSWEEKDKAGEVRFLFAGRLVKEKGIDVLLEALARLDEQGATLRVDVIGEGPRRDACEAAARRAETVKTDVLEPVAYGIEFFALLQQYHAIVVPSLSDEQPRLVFDAFARAVPVLASRTDGLTPHVIEGETGRLFETGSAEALAGLLAGIAEHPLELRRLGMNGLETARGLTHKEMHRARWRILADWLDAS